MTSNNFTSIPKLPASVQVLVLSDNNLDLSQMSELPSRLKLLDLCRAGTGAFQNYTFPSSIQELHLTDLNLSDMSGVKFAKGSKLKELKLRCCVSRIIDDKMIELPLGLKVLDVYGNFLEDINNVTIPQTVTFLDLRYNKLKSLEFKSHIETLYLCDNYSLSSLTIPKDLELRVLDLMGTEFRKLPPDLLGAEILTQLRLGFQVKVFDFLKVPINIRALQISRRCVVKGPHRYPYKIIFRSSFEVP